MNLIKSKLLIVQLIFSFTISSSAQCPSFSSTTISPAKCQSSCSVCVDDIISLSTQGVNLPDGADVNWYIDENSGFDPYFGDGTFIGSSLISTPSTPCSPIPALIGLMIDACGPEAQNEFLVIDVGGGFNTNDVIVDFAPQNNGGGGNDDLGFGFPCELTNGDPSLVGGCNNVQSIGPGQDLPPGSILVIFTSQGSSNIYDMSGLCGTCRDIYVMTSTCSRSKGAFSNHTSSGIRTQTWSVGCSGGSIIYDCGDLAGDGDQWIGGVVNGTCDFQGSAGPFELPSTVTNFSIAVPSDWCDMDLELVGIIEPLDLPDCCIEPYTTRFSLHIGCPEALESEIMKCDNGTGQAIFDLNEIIIEVQNGSTGTVHWYTDINLSNEIFSPYTSSSTTIYAAILDGDCLSEPVAISLIVLPQPEVVSTSIEECETLPNSNIANFNLNDIEDIINNGSGNDVSFYANSDKTGLISSRPFISGTTTIYATTDDGECESNTVPILLIVHRKPFAFSTKLSQCEDPEGSEMAEFILEEADDIIKGGVGSWTVKYYEDIDLNFEIFSPYLSGTAIIFAVVENENCSSEPVTITLEVFTAFTTEPKFINQCAIHPDSTTGTFSAQEFYDRINKGKPFDIYADSNGSELLILPYIGGDTIFYGHFENDSCSMGIFKIHITIGDPPDAMAVSDSACTDIMGNSFFNLDSIAARVRKDSSLNVEISKDNNFTDLLTGIYRSRGEVLFARVDGNGCYSATVRITLVSIVTPILDQASEVFICDSLILPQITGMNLSSNVGYYTEKNGRGKKYVTGDILYDTDTIYAYDSRWECSSEVELHINITQTPDAGDDNSVSVCSGTIVPLKTLVNGDDFGFFIDIDNSNKLFNGNFITNGLMGTYRFKYLIDPIFPCEGDSSIITVNIVDDVTAGNDLIVKLCQNDSVNLLPLLGGADLGGVFVDADNSGGLANGSSIFNGTKTGAGNWHIFYIVGDDVTCPADTAILTIELLRAIDINDLLDVETCDYYILPAITGTDLTGDEAYYNLGRGNGQIFHPGDTIRQGMELFIYDNSEGICPDEESFIITINKSTTNQINGILCLGNSLTFNGTLYDKNNPEGLEILKGANAHGCDSILTIALSFYPLASSNYSKTLCSGESIIINGNLYNESKTQGIEIIKNASINGCDSTVNIDLSFTSYPNGLDIRTICQEDTIVINGTEYHLNNPSGKDTLIGASVDGCDSISTVQVNFHNTTSNISQTLCGNETIKVGLQTFDRNNPSGVVTLKNASYRGCDSLVAVDLTFFENGINFITGNLCKGNSFEINGKVYDINNPTGSDTLLNASSNGCDSIINIDFSFIDAVFSSITMDICRSESITINGTIYNENKLSGTDTLINASSAGCDSIVMVQITLLEHSDSNINLDLCKGERIIINGVIYDEDNFIGIELLPNAATNGCDSIINISLNFDNYFIEPNGDQIELLLGDSITLPFDTDMNFTDISWSTTEGLSCIDCLNPVARPLKTTTYIVTLTDANGCQLTAKITIVIKESGSVFVPNSFTPNGDGINDHFKAFSDQNILQINQFYIYDRWGDFIYKEENTNINDNKSHIGWNGQFNNKSMNPGVYVYMISFRTVGGKDIIQTGSVTLLK